MHLRLARPAARNALDRALVAELTAALATLPAGTRRVVLGGEGPAFCAGADLAWMLAAGGGAGADGADDAGPAQALGGLFAALERVPALVVGHAHGAVMGGGLGLLAACDLVVVEAGCRLALPEVGLGLVPALIAPALVARIGLAAARRLALTGASITAEDACRLGLADHLAADRGAAEAHIEGPWGEGLGHAAPGAVAEVKALFREVADTAPALLPPRLAARLTARLASEEARLGGEARRARRPPPWATGRL